MKISRVVTGYLEENCYIIENNNEVLVVDPGDDYELIKKEIGKRKVLAVLITHYHFDHIGALDNILNDYKVDVIDFNSSLEQKIGNFSFKIIKTPGHKDDCVTFYFEKDKIMFTGDFLFRASVGRTDLDSGDQFKMKESLKKIKTYPEDIKIYPGHGESSTLSYEFKNNIFMRW